ncbi:GNAT family N-acetyltransferase [Azospirillum sp.]|uniref:GNAT family N-acetyltransferase n=1 Tax=Azospirillum sp. TaxID=34012 RepID=UPI002D6DACC4|nr:GNAT family N-acetyltransferase [Azospirillum sp.]HYD68432.1 GNAT family N-acetyltransferase [Azospirillum sp.]
MGTNGAVWRPMTAADLDTVLRIAERVHVDYPESPAVFEERLSLYPAGCRVAEIGGDAVGYAVLHPGRLGAPPALDTLLGGLPDPADCLYLHDVALLTQARGHGLGEAVLAVAEDLARAGGWAWLALTSTPGALSYWERQGFVPWNGAGETLARKLASYGEGMAYRVRRAG